MIEDLKPYSEYKDSGLPWLGEVPAHWEIARSKRLFKQRKEFAQPEDQQLSATQAYGVIPQALYEQKTGYRVVKISMHLDKRKHVQADDFVISMRSFQGGLERAWAAGAIRSSYVVLEPSKDVAPGYFQYLFKSHQYINALRATSDFIRDGQDLNFDNFCGVALPLIPLQEQTAIACFLTWATNRLDRAIRAKRRIIALLNEQKQAIIHRAVTRGLDPSVPLKDSGIPWQGEIPEHWEVITIGAISELLQTGPFGSQLHQSDYVSGGIPVINPSHFPSGVIRHSSGVTITTEKAVALSRHRLRSNDILIARRGDLGRCAAATESEEGWICGTGSLLLRCKTSVIQPDFLQIVFSSRGMCQMLELSSIGATMANLNEGSVARQRIPLPPLAEQEEIVASIRISSEADNGAIIRLEREITLLREYRTRLIADVVTGKLDVREVAAEFPEEVEPLATEEPGDGIDTLEPEEDEGFELP